MIWWNKDKKSRRADWTAVCSPKRDLMSDAAAWCRQCESRGKFYYHYTNTRWWFEKESDAILFSLTWSEV